MAPYAPFNHTLSLPDISPLRTPTPLPRRSLLPTVISLPTTTPPQVTQVSSLKDALPHHGIGPVVLEPSTSPNAALTAFSHRHNNTQSPFRPAYLAVLAIPLLFLVFVYFYLRRREKQKPALRVYTIPPLVNGDDDPFRGHSDLETSRIQQLPRDRIRTMNAVEGAATLTSPPHDFTIFSPRLPSPSPAQSPRSQWGYLSAFSSRSCSEPPSPMESVKTFASDISAQPLTPSTPSFFPPFETISESPQQTISFSIEEKEERGAKTEGRYTWDFRCRGLVDSLSRFSFGSVLDISPSNNAPKLADGNLEASSDIQNPTVEKNIPSSDGNGNIDQVADFSQKSGLASPEVSFVLPSLKIPDETSLSDALEPSPPSKNGPSIAEYASTPSSTPSPVTDSDSALSTPEAPFLPGLSTPAIVNPRTPDDVKGDMQDFLGEVGLDLDLGSDFAPLVVQFGLLETSDNDLISVPDLPYVSTPKNVKKRPVLSKPNHRILAPVSSSLKIFVPNPAIFASLPVCVTEDSFSASSNRSDDCLLSPLSALGLQTHSKMYLNPTGLKRASSEVNLRSLRKPGLSTFQNAPLAASSFKTLALLGGKATVSDPLVLEFANSEESVILCSSPSMPLSVELACLSSIAKRIKTKLV